MEIKLCKWAFRWEFSSACLKQHFGREERLFQPKHYFHFQSLAPLLVSFFTHNQCQIFPVAKNENEKPRPGVRGWRGGLKWKNSTLFKICRKTLHGEQNCWICDVLLTGFPIQILLHKLNVEQREVISRLSVTFITHKLEEHLFGTFTVS